jgi:hypothetical protein
VIGGTGEIAACGSSTYSVITVVDPGSTGDLIRKGTVADTIQDGSSSGYWNVVVLLSLILVIMIAVFL